MNDERTWTISQLADEFDLTTSTIRFYEEKGLLAPSRSKGGQRMYSRSDRARLKLVLRGVRFGYSLKQCGEILGMAEADPNQAEQVIKAYKYGTKLLGELEVRIDELQLMRRDLWDLRERLLARMRELGVDLDGI